MYQQYGLTVTSTLAGTPAIAAGIGGGSIDVGDFSLTSWLEASVGNPNLVSVASPSPKSSPFYLMVKPTITTPQDLIGKTVVINAPPGTPSEIGFQYILGTMNLTESQVQVSFLGNPNLELQALLSGQADAAVISPPRNIEAANNGFIQMGPASTATAYGEPDQLVVSRSYLAANPGLVDNFLKATLDAYRYLYVTMKDVSGNASSISSAAAAGVNTTQIISILSTFTGFNSTLVRQSLQIYNEQNLLSPPMLKTNSTFQASYYRALSVYPQTGSVNVTDIQNYNIIDQLNAPCGFVYNIWGGSPPAPAK